MRSRFCRRRGANAIEFALTLPAFLFALFGTMQLGLFFFAWMMADEGARRACNTAAMLDESSGDLETTAKDEMNAYYGLGGFTCASLSCNAALSGAAPDRVLTCTATANLSNIYGISVLPLTLNVEHERLLAFQ